jgi:hypothetical protein
VNAAAVILVPVANLVTPSKTTNVNLIVLILPAKVVTKVAIPTFAILAPPVTTMMAAYAFLALTI